MAARAPGRAGTRQEALLGAWEDLGGRSPLAGGLGAWGLAGAWIGGLDKDRLNDYH